MISYWEKEYYLNDCDVAVIGAGYVGLSAAYHIKQISPEINVQVFERGALPSGASTKNAGFACFGSLSEILSDRSLMTDQQIKDLVAERYSGIQFISNLLGADRIDLKFNGGYELFTEKEERLYKECTQYISEINELLYPIFEQKVFEERNDLIPELGMNGIDHLIYNPLEGELNPVKLLKALQELCIRHSINLNYGMSISKVSSQNGSCMLSLENGISLECKKVIIATNGFASKLIDLEVKPARTQVLITKPMPNLKIKGCFHMDQGYYYFRNVGNRILFGGGRNLDFKGETTDTLETTEIVQNELVRLLNDVILPGKNVEIEHSWSGIMGIGKAKFPIVKEVNKNIYTAVRLGGMGVAIGVSTGKKVADLVLSQYST